jgi:hypothetical protein
VENPIHRYAIGSRTEGLKYNSDGSLDLYIQAEAPRSHGSNWLPAPAGPFVLTMRLYLPKPAILNGTYRIPPVLCTDCVMSRFALFPTLSQRITVRACSGASLRDATVQ